MQVLRQMIRGKREFGRMLLKEEDEEVEEEETQRMSELERGPKARLFLKCVPKAMHSVYE